MLDRHRLLHALSDCAIGHTIDYHHTVPSTMPVAHELARQPGTRSGTLVVAEEQTAGRGRQARRWEAPPAQALLVSVLLQPPIHVPVKQLPMAIGVAAAAAIESFAPGLAGHVGLKWPNDLLVGAGMADAAKVGGILMEARYDGGGLAHVVAGIGINVHQRAADLPTPQPGAPPASLHHFLEQQGHGNTPPLDRTALLIALCRSLALHLSPAMNGSELLMRWRQRLWTLGEHVCLYERGEVLWAGRAVDVDAEGQLVVVNGAGETRRFLAGDVSVRSA
jgi:BirA family biotin operon repressor/biotin-[acetyl-CoA-carboxylase] ligase